MHLFLNKPKTRILVRRCIKYTYDENKLIKEPYVQARRLCTGHNQVISVRGAYVHDLISQCF